MRKRPETRSRPARPAIQLREHQAETVRGISEAFASGVRTVFLHAPVGSGKSLIHLLVAKEAGSAYVTTPQVLLVDQYDRDTADLGKFVGLAMTLKGRRNYPCPYERGLPRGNRRATADGAPCTFLEDWPKECPKLLDCPYYLARHSAQSSPTSVTTLAYAVVGIVRQLSRPAAAEHGEELEEDGDRSILGPGWHPRTLLVVDEAHGLPNGLVNFFAVEVGEKTLPGFDFQAIGRAADPLQHMRDELPGYLERLTDGLKELRVTGGGDTAAELRVLEEQHKLIRRAERFIENLSREDVVWVHDFERSPLKHRWRPLTVAPFSGSLWAQAPRILLSSATFFGFETLERDLGLPGPFRVVTVPDAFPPSSAPIHLLGSVTLKRETMASQLPEVVREISRLARVHKSERGLVHCNAYPVRDFIERNADATLARRLVLHTREDRIASLDGWVHNGRDDTIFVAVAMSEGLDLAGDLARWQVIVKAPFPNLGDAWVMRRRDAADGRSWYTEQTIVDILQACGRIMRSKEDHGTTYILDANALRIVRQHWGGLPEWFKSRVDAARASGGPAA